MRKGTIKPLFILRVCLEDLQKPVAKCVWVYKILSDKDCEGLPVLGMVTSSQNREQLDPHKNCQEPGYQELFCARDSRTSRLQTAKGGLALLWHLSHHPGGLPVFTKSALWMSALPWTSPSTWFINAGPQHSLTVKAPHPSALGALREGKPVKEGAWGTAVSREKITVLCLPFPFVPCSLLSQVSSSFVHAERQEQMDFTWRACPHSGSTLSFSRQHSTTQQHPPSPCHHLPSCPSPLLAVAWHRGTWKFAVMFESQPKLKARPRDWSESLKNIWH